MLREQVLNVVLSLLLALALIVLIMITHAYACIHARQMCIRMCVEDHVHGHMQICACTLPHVETAHLLCARNTK